MTGSTYLDYDKALAKGMRLIRSGADPNFGLLIVVGINVGLRVGDLLNLSFADLKKDVINIVEQKNGNKRKIKVTAPIKRAMEHFQDSLAYELGGHPFTSQKGTVYSIQQINRKLKDHFKGKRISTHSLRKTWGRFIWESSNHSPKALTLLNQHFGHANFSDTKRYLGITQDEMDSVFDFFE
ncbi:tyrosine-type recombinase/integrase [Flagellimonas profundi]|uniref:Tyrosine-type recombinase/integrase n=1 Tax=Flagellimonas profundi TaxID=2915620 RepID=A0ABS3FD85_9FLAO|nr:tyrosine-type recombinase/integrase [Allomuricauda profundi]MBO0340936.1 tyrosine-type recombinase/integrase [Allomuricauda profundi]